MVSRLAEERFLFNIMKPLHLQIINLVCTCKTNLILVYLLFGTRFLSLFCIQKFLYVIILNIYDGFGEFIIVLVVMHRLSLVMVINFSIVTVS